MYEPREESFRTPRGQTVTMLVRADTNDWNTLASCLNEDEYELRGLHLVGRALDIGAYTGGVTVALAVDNPELKVVAIEPVPGNVELLYRNLEANGLLDRVTVHEAAAGDGGDVNLRYGYSGSELACHHAFVGNMSMLEEPGPDNPHTLVTLRSMRMPAEPYSFVKIDCEGCEWDVDLAPYPLIHGEWHPVRGHTQAEFIERLIDTHEVTFTGPPEGPGGFVAVWR
jgi:FkbM family methyltransferase